jgi:prepilin-type N-terminal cleavage/methylation domain-containing protein
MKYTVHKKGFTLIELLVVIAIIGILSAIVLASLNEARVKSANASIMANLSGIRAQAELFYSGNGEQYAIPPNVATSGQFLNGCSPAISSAPNHIFEVDGVVRAILEAKNNAGPNPPGISVNARCMADQTRWFVAIALKKPYLTNNWFCVDYNGTAKMTVNSPTSLGSVCQ